MRTVLILGARAPVALDHARRFARQGWTVHVADSIPCRISGWSRAVRRTFALPSPRFDPRAFAAALARVIREQRVDLLLPTCEEVFYVSRYRSLLPSEANVFVDDFEKLRALHSKLAFLQIARDCGAVVPEGAAVTTLAEARTVSGGRPLVLKPEYSRFGVHVRIYPHGIPDGAPELEPRGRWAAQEYLEGEELCSYGVAVGGRLTAHVVYRPKHRLARSSSYYFEPAAAPQVRDVVTRLVAKIGFTGQISFDWIRLADGRCVVLECNPRAISGVHLFAVDDPLPAAICGEVGVVVEPRAARPRAISVVMLTAGLAAAVRSGSLTPWRRDLERAGDVIGVRGDRLPLAGGIADIGSHFLRSWRHRCSLREAATRDTEWDGEALPEC